MPYPIKIILVDDHDAMRESMKTLLDDDERFSVIAQFKSGAEAIQKAGELHPDIILMDVNMTPINGFEATQKITAAFPSIKIIGISISNNPQYAIKMFEQGAKGFVTKTSAFSELKTAIQNVYDGENYLCEEIKKKIPPKKTDMNSDNFKN